MMERKTQCSYVQDSYAVGHPFSNTFYPVHSSVLLFAHVHAAGLNLFVDQTRCAESVSPRVFIMACLTLGQR